MFKMTTLTFMWKTGWQGGKLGSSWVVLVNGPVDGSKREETEKGGKVPRFHIYLESRSGQMCY